MAPTRKQKKALALARKFEQQNDLDGAIKAYLEADAPLDAAAALAKHARHEQAGKLLLSTLGVPPEEVGTLGPDGRKRARMAASYLTRASDPSTAVSLFVALGERNRAAELLERGGDLVGAQRLREGGGFRRQSTSAPSQSGRTQGAQADSRERARALEREGKLQVAAKLYMQLQLHGDAGRVLAAMGQVSAAAEMFEKAKMAYEAAACYLRCGDADRGLTQLVRVPRNDPRYRKAANHAIRLANEQGSLSFQVEHFLGELVSSGPVDAEERQSLLLLADLYAKEGMFQNARDAVKRVLARYQDDPEARQRLDQYAAAGNAGSDLYRKISAQDSGFTGESGPRPQDSRPNEVLPGLPALPQAPRLPSLGRDFSQEPATGPVPPTPYPPAAYAPPAQGQSQPYPSQAPGPTVHGKASTGNSAQPDPGAGQTQMGGAGGFPLIPPLADTASGTQAPVAATPAHQQAQPQPGGLAPVLTGPAEPADPFEIGGVVDNRYRIDARLGVGGSAIVFRAYDQELEEAVALKVFLSEIPDPELQQQSLARFKQELKLNRQLVHDNILRLYDIGMYRGRRYISMELLVGRCLDELLEGPPLPIEQSMAYLLQSCRGLHVAHQRGVIHRDIKPQNIFITEDDLVKVMDFGIAKKSGGGGNLTKTGMMAGTPRYMSPEQINDFSAVGPQADLYSLGVVAYHLFTGSVPFDHDELMPLLMMHINQQPRPPRELRPEIPEELDKLVLRLLEKDPANRPTSCLELARALQQMMGRFR